MKRFIVTTCVTCGGLGYFPKGSGTVASMVAVGFWWWLLERFQWPWVLGLIILITIISALVIPFYELTLQSKDSGTIVIDEWIGMGIAMITAGSDWRLLLTAFVAFRVFDIVKPWGVRYFDQRYLKGWGVVLDDCVAGVYALVVVEVVKLWLM